MRLKNIFSLTILTFFGFVSIDSVALNIDETRHLLTRTGFAPAPHEFSEYEQLSRKQAVKKILKEIRQNPITPIPSLMLDQHYDANQSAIPVKNGCTILSDEIKADTPHDIYSRRYAEYQSMKSWWWTEMLNTPSPLTERLTLLWHDHFATSFSHEALALFQNNLTLRSLGSTDFKSLAIAMLYDPAMIYFLDNHKNIVTSHNENLAREFLELFTMGEGNYSQNDIKALAQVLTGHSITNNTCEHVYNEEDAYKGEINLLGKRGRFSIEKAVDIIFEHEVVSEFIVERFWIEFISPTYTKKQIQPLAKSFKKNNYDIKLLLEEIFNHKQFWADANRASLVKSPVELLVGMTRSFGVWMPTPDLLMGDSRELKHDLFNPPNVSGWKENDGWINPRSAVLRSLAVNRIWRAKENIDGLRSDHLTLNDGLLILASSQHYAKREPRNFYVYVNDKLIEHFTLKMGDQEDKKNALGLIQEPELFYIPAADLPEEIKTVSIDYKIDPLLYEGKHRPLLMIHWVEHEGLRYSPIAAKQKVKASHNKKTPMGMLVETSTLTFDLQKIKSQYAIKINDDRLFMAYNTATPIIAELYTYGNEQVFPIKPAGLSFESLPTDLLGDFKSLAKRKDTMISGVPVLSILPKNTALTETTLTALKPLQALTYSPYYQLK